MSERKLQKFRHLPGSTSVRCGVGMERRRRRRREFFERFEQRLDDFCEGKSTFATHFRDRNVVSAAFLDQPTKFQWKLNTKSSTGEAKCELYQD